MPKRRTDIEEFVFDEDVEPAGSDRVSGDDVFMRAISPTQDFLPGAMLAGDHDALQAARKVVDDAVSKIEPSARTTWDGTIATVRSKDGEVLDRVEVHGASYDRKHDEASGVRFDLTGLKSNAT